MRVALVTPSDSNDRRANSGIPYYMGRALARYAEIVPIPPPQSAVRMVASGGARISRRLLGTSYLADFSIPAAFEQGLQLGRALARLQLDFVLAPFASAQAAMLPRGIPLIYSSDTTFRLIEDCSPHSAVYPL